MISHNIKTLLVLITLTFVGCLNQEYDYKENHPLYIEHKHEHPHHHHDHTTKDKNNVNEFTTIVKELEDQERDIWQQPYKVIEMLGSLEGKTVADIGAGTGYFSFRLAKEAAKVIATDIDVRFIQYMDSIKLKFTEPIQDRIDIRLCNEDSPNLQLEEADAVILVNVYPYIKNRIAYFKKVARGMKPGGKLLVVNYKKRKLTEGQTPPKELKIPVSDVEAELKIAGYKLIETDDSTLDYQYIVLVQKP